MDVSQICQEYVSGESANRGPKDLAKGIAAGDVDLLTLVEALGVYLTSTVVENRSRGTRLLSEVLCQLSSHQFTPEDVHYLTVFYCDRLKDRAVIIPTVLLGLHSLVSYQTISNDDVVAVSRAVFKEVHNQTMQQSDRQLVYEIMELFLTTYLQAVKVLGSEFVLGYIQVMDGEKDPRNLLIVFRSVHTIITHLQYDVLAEDLFEVISCYFPIDFTPPSNDPFAVTPDQLILELRRCLTATPKFAEFALPLLMEKMSSDIESAKIDSLRTLAAGAGGYGADGLRLYLHVLWTGLRREVFQSMSKTAEEACCDAVTMVTRALATPSHDTSEGSHDLNEFVQNAWKDLKRHLCEPELRLLKPAGGLLLAIARGSLHACNTLVDCAVPMLLVSTRRAVLEVLLDFVKLLRELASSQKDLNCLSKYKEQMIPLLVTALGDDHTPLTIVAMRVIASLLDTEEFLSPAELNLCVEHLQTLALNSEESSIRLESCSCLSQFAGHNAHYVQQNLVPPLVDTLLNDGTRMEVDPSPPPAPSLLNLLTALSHHPTVCTLTLPSFLDVLQSQSHDPALEGHLHLAIAAATSAFNVVQTVLAVDEHKVPFQLYLSEHIVGRIIGMCVEAAAVTGSVTANSCTVLTDETVLSVLASLLRSYAQTLDLSLSQKLMELVLHVFYEGHLESLGLTQPDGIAFHPLIPQSSYTVTQTVLLLTATIGSLQPEVISRHCQVLLPPLLHLSTHTTHPHTSLHASQCYASIINKIKDDSNLTARVETDLQLLWEQVAKGAGEGVVRCRGLDTWIWLTKALVMRGHALGKEALSKLLVLLSDGEIGHRAADGFKIILSDPETVLNRHTHAIVRLMYKQQVFVTVEAELVQLFHRGTPGVQQHVLKALSHLMQGVPKQVLVDELPSLFPLLLKSLRDGEGDMVKLPTLEALHAILHDTPLSVVDHVPSLLPLLLELTHTSPLMTVRISALKCVGAMTTIPSHVVYPFQRDVLHGLKVSLDDRKRLVRKAAVESRSKWFLLGDL